MDLITIETTAGMFTVELYRLHAPKTCYNFTELVKIGATI
jgi:cyclophilin family peptidyl-prolyl cis-trans isomerase